MTQPLDLTKGQQACAGSPDLHLQVCTMLAEDLAERLVQTSLPLGRGDLAATAAQAHRHKGACLTAGALQLGRIFHDLDRACRSGDALDARRHADLLPAAAAAFQVALAQFVLKKH